MTDRDQLREKILEALGSLEDWQLEAMARLAAPLDHRLRFGNPPRVLGFTKLERLEGLVRGEMEIGPLHLNPHGVAHGMIGFGLIDNAMGSAVTAASERPCIAVEVKIQFARPLRPGRYVVEGRATHIGGRIAIAEGRIFDGVGDVAVLGTGTFYLTT